MDKLLVFGGSGGTGKQVIQQALQADYKVKAVIRNPAHFKMGHPNLTIIKGDVLNQATFQDEIKGVDAVISCLGTPKVQVTKLYSEGMENIIAAMKQFNVSRILCISSSAISIPPKSSFIMTFLLKNVLQRIYKPIYADMISMENKLKSSGLDYTIVRAPKLTDGKKTNEYRLVTHQPLKRIPTLSRADLADFMVKNIKEKKSFISTIEIAY